MSPSKTRSKGRGSGDERVEVVKHASLTDTSRSTLEVGEVRSDLSAHKGVRFTSSG